MNKTVILSGVEGYIGNALLQRLLYKGYKVIGIDNFMKDEMVEEMGSFSAIPSLSIEDKYKKLRDLGDYNFVAMDVTKNYNEMIRILEKHKPIAFINLAHIPSGPYSMISRSHADKTLYNNIVGTNNIMWAIKESCPDCHYITIGTTGEYDHYSNIDIEEGYIEMEYKGRKSNEMIYPRRPGSIYHVSKTGSTFLIDFMARSWGLRCTEPQQSIVFGAYTDEINETKIYSNLNSDEAFGTVANRFIVQALLKEPLTIYGEGKHKRGFLSLNDSVQAMMIALENPAERGRVQVWNQLSEWWSMNDIAKFVIDAGKKVGIDVKTKNIPTPRNEHTGDHYYKYVTKNLDNLGYKKTRTVEQEAEYLMFLLKDVDLSGLKKVIMPKIKWK